MNPGDLDSSPLELGNLSKSLNEVLILAMLADGPKHGYQLAVELEERSGGLFRFKHGTLYPILHKLEEAGHIVGTWSDQGLRAKRKAYSLTTSGTRHVAALRAAWRDLAARLLATIAEERP